MSCQDGNVLDLSASGARVRVAEKPGYEIGDRCTLRLKTERQTVRLDARVAWVNRDGLLKPVWTMGVEFLDTRPAVRQMIESLAITGYADPRSAQKKASTPQAAASGSHPSGAPDEAAAHATDSGGAIATIEPPDLYEVMEIDPDADEGMIRTKYHELVRKYHPDSGGAEASSERFSMVSKAYSVLRDPGLRERYDKRFGRSAA